MVSIEIKLILSWDVFERIFLSHVLCVQKIALRIHDSRMK